MHLYTSKHPLIQEALLLVEQIDPVGMSRDAARALIAVSLVHDDEYEARRQCLLIENQWHRYQILIELYAAHGREEDEQTILMMIRQMQAEEETDGRDEMSQFMRVKTKLLTGWRSSPDRVMHERDDVDRALDRSLYRMNRFLAYGAPRCAVFNEYCVRIIYGDYDAVAPAMDMAGDNMIERDCVTLAIAKSHAYSGSPVKARKYLSSIVSHEHRIELSLAIFHVEREMGYEDASLLKS